MKKRQVIFKGQTSWFMTPEFIGDKDELAQSSGTQSCDESWGMIARRFIHAKTKDEFSKASAWAQRQYHDSAKSSQSQEPGLYRLPDTTLDEILVVHEDLGTTGIQAMAQCSACGRTHFLIYRPDKTTNAAERCLTCASQLITRGAMPSPEAWGAALDMYREPAATYRIAVPGDFPEIERTLKEVAAKRQDENLASDEGFDAAAKKWLTDMMKDSNAAAHMNAPVKILKIVGYSGDEFIYEVLFRDWSTAVLRSRFLKKAK